MRPTKSAARVSRARQANLRGLLVGLLGARLPAFWIQILTMVASIFTLLWVALNGPAKRASDPLIIAITASLIVSYYLFIHDLTVLLIPIVVTLDRFLFTDINDDAEEAHRAVDRAAAWMAAALLVAPMCIFLIPEYFYLVSLPLCAFMVILIRCFPREPQPLNSVSHK